ncbi:DUF4172 domain-containing protein [Paraflavisolibacter sp. H34]|uniref:Fic family protein n=1 Tax=Huijunlia imazamoxiresistens TaxID=3127457 RepID=UPI00301AFC57
MAHFILNFEPIKLSIRLMSYNRQQPDWPHFQYNLQALEDALFQFAEQAGYVSGLLEAMPEGTQTEALIDLMVAEAIKTSEIEGEYLSRQDVVSSIRNHLGLSPTPEPVRDRMAGGAGELMVDVRRTYEEELTEEKLFAWHQMLLSGNIKINTGTWRTNEAPMQVVSGAIGRETIHFEAPPSSRVPGEMKAFLRWFNETAPGGREELKKAPVRAARSLLRFYTGSTRPMGSKKGQQNHIPA